MNSLKHVQRMDRKTRDQLKAMIDRLSSNQVSALDQLVTWMICEPIRHSQYLSPEDGEKSNQ